MSEKFECAHEVALRIEEKCAEVNGKYVVNEHNLESLCKVYDFFRSVSDEEDGKIEILDIRPESGCVIVSVEVSSVDLHRDGMANFVDILQYVNTIDIASTKPDGIVIRVGVKDVWEAVE